MLPTCGKPAGVKIVEVRNVERIEHMPRCAGIYQLFVIRPTYETDIEGGYDYDIAITQRSIRSLSIASSSMYRENWLT